MTLSRSRLSAVLVVLMFVTSAHAQSRRVAVLDFTNTTKDPAVEWLGPAVAETITTKLNAIRNLQLVERAQLYKVLQEQKLNLSDLVDPSHAIQVGKLLEAEQVVLGGYSVFGGTVRFTARFVDTTTGGIVATSQVNGVIDPKNPNGLWTAFDQLAQATIDSLNTRVAIVQGLPQAIPVTPDKRVEPTPEERAKLAKAPTTSLAAQEAYGRGLVAYRKHQWPEAARELEGATSLDPDYAQAWHELGKVLDELGRWAEALRAQEMAYQLYARRGDEQGQAKTLNNIGTVHVKQGRYAEALSYYERSLRLSERLGDEPTEAATLSNIGTVERNRARYHEALSYYLRSLRLWEKLGSEPGQARTLMNIGNIHVNRAQYAEALSYYERTLRFNEKTGNEPAQAEVLNNIGTVHRSQGRYAEALSTYELSLKLSEKLASAPRQAVTLNNIGIVYRSQGRHPQALVYHERALALAEKLGDEPTQARTLNNIGAVHTDQGNYAKALTYLERAIMIADRLGMPERDRIRQNRDRIRSSVR